MSGYDDEQRWEADRLVERLGPHACMDPERALLLGREILKVVNRMHREAPHPRFNDDLAFFKIHGYYVEQSHRTVAPPEPEPRELAVETPEIPSVTQEAPVAADQPGLLW